MHSKKSAGSKAIVAYVPALHAGYVSFFKKYQGGDFFILGKSLILRTPRMERDIRALEPEEAQRLIKALQVFNTVSVLTTASIKKSLRKYRIIVMPDEDISRNIAHEFLKGCTVTFEKTFLRWDKMISTTEFVVDPNRKISTNNRDVKRIQAAFKEAGQSPDWWRQIGAVLVKGDTIQIRSYNKHFPTSATTGIMGDPRSNFDAGEQPEIYLSIHAEADVIAQAARKGISLVGAELYATTFPCPNCARLIVRAGIKRLYYAQGYSKLDAEEILKSGDVEVVLVKEK